jgi:hypothetical protein
MLFAIYIRRRNLDYGKKKEKEKKKEYLISSKGKSFAEYLVRYTS